MKCSQPGAGRFLIEQLKKLAIIVVIQLFRVFQSLVDLLRTSQIFIKSIIEVNAVVCRLPSDGRVDQFNGW